MLTTTDGTTYKSRPKLLIEFFRSSRDKWKHKCLQAKADLKSARNSCRWMQHSRDQWKQRAGQLQAELDTFRAQQKTAAR